MDFTLCFLVAESAFAEALQVDALSFNDVIYPGVDLRYSMEVHMPRYYRSVKIYVQECAAQDRI